ARAPAARGRDRLLQHHQVLHRSVSGIDYDHGQRDHPAQGTPRRRLLRSAGSVVAKTDGIVVVVGAGFGGLRVARALRRAPVQVMLLDRNNYHLFQPLLYQVATAGLEPEQIAKPVRSILRAQTNFDFRMVEVTGVDFAQRRLDTSGGHLSYDFLVLAHGGETNFFGLESMTTHGLG